MTNYSFYIVEYGGSSIPQDAWTDVQRDAGTKVARYERIYTVTWIEPSSRDMAVCTIADAMYAFERLQAEGGAIQSASVGSVSESRAAVSAPDTSPAAQEQEFYRCLCLYADVYRGCG